MSGSGRSGHRVWAEIDLGALRRNMATIVKRTGPGTRVLAVVKADAYGHGAVPVARALAGCDGLWGFGVGDSQEALALRAAGIAQPILILGTIIDEETPQVVRNDIRVCIHSMDRIGALEQESRSQGRRTKVHVMTDTGMGRLGALPARARELARAVGRSRWLELEGVATHVSSSRPGHPFTVVQRERLLALLASLREDGIDPPMVHFANTAAILGGEGAGFPLVRPGVSLYGMQGGDFLPVLSLRTQVVYFKDVPAGTPIGYNGTHVAARPTRIATLPIGYNDGLAYRLSNRGRALVRGQIAPIVGSISMDYTMIDVGAIAGVAVGDAVTLIGRDGKHAIGVPEIASLVGTIPYEVVCSVGKRVQRVYVEDEREPVREAAAAAAKGRPPTLARVRTAAVRGASARRLRPHVPRSLPEGREDAAGRSSNVA